MNHPQTVIARIVAAFEAVEYPGDRFLQGSYEGEEPYNEIGPFVGKTNWREISSEFLDARASALSFFSEAGFRFFLPAYLAADLKEELQSADPLFHLIQGFSEGKSEIPAHNRTFIRRFGGHILVNPRRYGGMTFFDLARFRLSVFAREEAGAIAAYLKCRRDRAESKLEKAQIEAALEAFWLERARSAPRQKDLQEHLREEAEFLEAILADQSAHS